MTKQTKTIKKIKTIGVFYNPEKSGLQKIFDELEIWALKHKISLKFISNWQSRELALTIENLDFAICLGGDGTILSVGRFLAGTNIAILGVNLGRLGFLAEINKQDLNAELDNILSCKDYKIETRYILDIKVVRENKIFKEHLCINDIAVKNGEKSRIIDIDLFIDSEFVVRYVGDGLIVSTPTGSTAYSLAAGGPIVYPDLSVFVITAICPHTLNLRPLVVQSDKKLEVQVLEQKDMVLSIDGQISEKLFLNDKILITKSRKTMKLFTSQNYSYFDVLRKKLSWGNR